MIDINKFRAIIIEKKSSIEEVSCNLGVNKSTIYRKLQQNGETFTLKEVNVLVKLLNLTDNEIINIFFASNIA